MADELSESAMSSWWIVGLCFLPWDCSYNSFYGAQVPGGGGQSQRKVARLLLSQRSPYSYPFGFGNSSGDRVTSTMIGTLCSDLNQCFTSFRFPDPHNNPGELLWYPRGCVVEGWPLPSEPEVPGVESLVEYWCLCDLRQTIWTLCYMTFSCVKWSHSAWSPGVVWNRWVNNVWYVKVLNSCC